MEESPGSSEEGKESRSIARARVVIQERIAIARCHRIPAVLRGNPVTWMALQIIESATVGEDHLVRKGGETMTHKWCLRCKIGGVIHTESWEIIVLWYLNDFYFYETNSWRKVQARRRWKFTCEKRWPYEDVEYDPEWNLVKEISPVSHDVVVIRWKSPVRTTEMMTKPNFPSRSEEGTERQLEGNENNKLNALPEDDQQTKYESSWVRRYLEVQKCRWYVEIDP